ncbi:MAG: hypothetical protein HYV90_02415 [Candidatus Woesebacteria bacterium]|nr:MAG: hypothetical protein HYV90_02415 [Candidatus Woesebacteria bacterium]
MEFKRDESNGSKMSWVRELVDPDGSLPKIELEDDPRQKEKHIKNILLDGQKIGELSIGGSGKFRHFEKVSLSETDRPKGCGLATYLLAIEEAQKDGAVFETTSWYLTEDSVKIWKILAEKGVATVVDEFVQVTDVPQFMGKYRVYTK